MNQINQDRPLVKQGIELDLRKFLNIIRARIRYIVLITLLLTVTSAITTYYIIDPVYQAKTLLMVTVASEKLQVSTNQINRVDPATGKDIATLPVLTMNTYLGQLKSEILMKRVLVALNLEDQTINGISRKIDATIIKDSNLIEVKVRDKDPHMALLIADAVSAQYLELMEEFMFSSVVVISPANLPTSPVNPKKINVILAFILGLIVSMCLVIVMEYLDRTVKTVEDVAAKLNLPVLGAIPVMTIRNVRQ